MPGLAKSHAASGPDLGLELAYAREQTDGLFGLIAPDALYSRPIAERHRLIFYLGHFEAFDWNLLARRGLSATAFNPTFDSLFERGIDPPPGEAPADSAADWPASSEVERYSAQTRAWIDAHLNDLNPTLLQMAVEHRHMHAETFAYLMHGIPYADKLPPETAQPSSRPAPANPMIPIAAGSATLGAVGDRFGWDNEYRAHEIPVPAFTLSKFKISNGEYLDFVREGGPAPHFWSKENASNGTGAWAYRGMFSRISLPLDWPVWVTWQQAAAYAEWRGFSLPNEAQYQLAASQSPGDPVRDNYGFNRWDPVPVNLGYENTNGHAPVQMTGNGWEWTSDVFAPFAGFHPHPFYPGYSADFFDGKHYVMKGASPRTASLLARPSFRNWFRPDYPHMYAGFRIAGN